MFQPFASHVILSPSQVSFGGVDDVAIHALPGTETMATGSISSPSSAAMIFVPGKRAMKNQHI